MSLRDVIQNATKAPLGFIARELGDTITLARSVDVRQKDNSTRSTWQAVAGLQSVRGQVEQVNAVRAQQMFGVETAATGVVVIQTTVEILADDVVAVESGHFSGRYFNVDELIFDQMTNSYTLGVREVPAVAVVP